jgi:chromosomal replication initiator protein
LSISGLKKKVKAVYNDAMSEQNYHEFWQEALSQIHEEYKNAGQENEFLLWFNLEYVEDTLSTITVAVASEFMWHLMQSKGNVDKVTKKICELTGQSITLKYIVRTKKSDADEANSSVSDTFSASSLSPEHSEKVAQRASAEEKKVLKHPQLRNDYTFDNFVPGDNSAYAFNASLAAAKNPGRAYNPILIYGGVGLGKTHLMQSIGNYIYSDKGPKIKICYLSAETFTNEFIFSISDRTTDKFKSKYRNLDVLLLDDIHFLQGKDSTQEELFHTFNALYDRNCQMVFTCDRPITELKGIEDRLRTRFSRGLSIDLQPPNYETRRAILVKKLEMQKKKIPADVIDYIAKNVQTNVRDLESSLTKMLGYAELVNKILTVQIAQEQLRDTFNSPLSGTISIETVQKVIADHYGISVSDIKSKKRDRKFVIPRQIALYIARKLTEYSFPELGNEFGGRDHTTAMHSYDKVEEQLKTDSSLNATIQLLMREVKDYKK